MLWSGKHCNWLNNGWSDCLMINSVLHIFVFLILLVNHDLIQCVSGLRVWKLWGKNTILVNPVDVTHSGHFMGKLTYKPFEEFEGLKKNIVYCLFLQLHLFGEQTLWAVIFSKSNLFPDSQLWRTLPPSNLLPCLYRLCVQDNLQISGDITVFQGGNGNSLFPPPSSAMARDFNTVSILEVCWCASRQCDLPIERQLNACRIPLLLLQLDWPPFLKDVGDEVVFLRLRFLSMFLDLQQECSLLLKPCFPWCKVLPWGLVLIKLCTKPGGR